MVFYLFWFVDSLANTSTWLRNKMVSSAKFYVSVFLAHYFFRKQSVCKTVVTAVESSAWTQQGYAADM